MRVFLFCFIFIVFWMTQKKDKLKKAGPKSGPKAASFPFPSLAALLQALTLRLATWNRVFPGGGSEDTTEAKAAATGLLCSRCLRSACVKPGT